MKVYGDMNFSLDRATVSALGCFDGVHAGHRAVIDTARRIALERALPLAVFTFSTPPRAFFAPDSTKMIMSTDEKLELLAELGVDICVCLPCSEEIFSLSGEAFIEKILLSKLRAAHIVCGYNYSFGKGGVGTPSLIRSYCDRDGIGITVVNEQVIDGCSVSSTLLRSLAESGEVERMTRLMGRPLSLSSSVIGGQQLARKLGFPTVNIIPDAARLLPRRGVYVTRVLFDGECRYGITNVGVRPTVDVGITCAETHLFDFDGDLYGKDIRIEFLHFIRPEQRFESVNALSEQVHRDIALARQYINMK